MPMQHRQLTRHRHRLNRSLDANQKPDQCAKMKTKLAITLAALLIGTGCSYLRSTTLRATDPKTGIVTEKTTARGWTFLDANASLVKFRNQSGTSTNGTNSYAAGTYATGVNESSSSTNLISMISAVAQGVAAGLK